jgi:hypothetical protein
LSRSCPARPVVALDQKRCSVGVCSAPEATIRQLSRGDAAHRGRRICKSTLVILTTPDEIETWLTAPWHEAQEAAAVIAAGRAARGSVEPKNDPEAIPNGARWPGPIFD